MAEKLLSLLDGDFSGATLNFGSVKEIDGSIHETADSQNGPEILQILRYFVQGLFLRSRVGLCHFSGG